MKPQPRRIKPHGKKPASRRAAKRVAATVRHYVTAKCEVCGLTEHDAPVKTRWVQGFPLDLCHECWKEPQPAFAHKRVSLIEARRRAEEDGTRADREEQRIELAQAAACYYAENIHDDRRVRLPVLVTEAARVRRTQLPYWRRIRAARAAFARGEIPSINETASEAAHYLRFEEDAFARDLFSGFCRAWEIPAELHDWAYDSARHGAWIPVMHHGGSYVIEPRIGGYLDHERADHAPCTSWGRLTPKEERGSGSWIAALNHLRGWDVARKPVRHLALADPADREFTAALLAEIEQKGVPRSSKPNAVFGLDRGELTFRIHVRMCELCRDATGDREARERSRKDHQFKCLDKRGTEGRPRLTWIDEQLRRDWNNYLLLSAAVAALGAAQKPS